MGNLRKCILFLVVAVTMVLASNACSDNGTVSTDRTVEENAMGTDVVLATISRIEGAGIFRSDKRLLRRIAYVETADGKSPWNNGGIWNVTRTGFERTQNLSGLAGVRKEIKEQFSSDFVSTTNVESWEFLKFKNLNRPLWSALAARLLIYIEEQTVDLPTASDIDGQADFLQRLYNKSNGVEEFRKDVEELEKNESCTIKSDIVFVLDISGSIGRSSFQEVINFTLQFVDGFDIGPTDNQVGVILFSDVGKTTFNLTKYSNKKSLLEGIRSIDYSKYKGTNTNIADGLCLLLEGFREGNGARLLENGVFRLAIVMTDGQSNRVSKQCNYSSTEDVAEKVHNFSPPILVFAIGVTDRINDKELQAIATHEEYVTYLPEFNERFFQEASDEQTYEFCYKSRIRIPLGKQVGTLKNGQKTRFEIPVPIEGLTIKLCVLEGHVIFYASCTIPNPNDALHDSNYEAINITCSDAFIRPYDSNDTTSNRASRQVDSTQSSSNLLYISLEGGREENEFVLETSAGDNRVEDETQEDVKYETQEDEWQLIVIMSCVGLVLLLTVITLLSVAFPILKKNW